MFQLEISDNTMKAKEDKNVLGMILNCIWWWGSGSMDLGSVEYTFIAITPWSILI